MWTFSSPCWCMLNSKFATKLACLFSKPNTRYYRRKCSNCSDYQPARQLWSTSQTTLIIVCFSVLKTNSRFIFCITCIFYSCPVGVEFSWTWLSVCSVTRLLQIPLKDHSVLYHRLYVAWFTAKQHLRFACDLGRCINLYCVVLL